jgi:hypothetical protein
LKLSAHLITAIPGEEFTWDSPTMVSLAFQSYSPVLFANQDLIEEIATVHAED